MAQRERNPADASRDAEDSYRERWRHDKVVRSTHGVNCTGSCSRTRFPYVRFTLVLCTLGASWAQHR